MSAAAFVAVWCIVMTLAEALKRSHPATENPALFSAFANCCRLLPMLIKNAQKQQQ